MDNQKTDKCNSCRNSPYHQSMYFCNIRKKIRCSKLTKERINVSLQSAKVFMEEEKLCIKPYCTLLDFHNLTCIYAILCIITHHDQY